MKLAWLLASSCDLRDSCFSADLRPLRFWYFSNGSPVLEPAAAKSSLEGRPTEDGRERDLDADRVFSLSSSSPSLPFETSRFTSPAVSTLMCLGLAEAGRNLRPNLMTIWPAHALIEKVA